MHDARREPAREFVCHLRTGFICESVDTCHLYHARDPSARRATTRRTRPFGLVLHPIPRPHAHQRSSPPTVNRWTPLWTRAWARAKRRAEHGTASVSRLGLSLSARLLAAMGVLARCRVAKQLPPPRRSRRAFRVMPERRVAACTASCVARRPLKSSGAGMWCSCLPCRPGVCSRACWWRGRRRGRRRSCRRPVWSRGAS